MFYSVTYICKSNKQKDAINKKLLLFSTYLPKYVFRH